MVYFIVQVHGCLPYVDMVLEEESGCPKAFDSEEEATLYAEEHCPWAYRVVAF